MIGRVRGGLLQLLLTNPDDTQQVFVMIDALSGNSPRRMLRRFARDRTRAKLLGRAARTCSTSCSGIGSSCAACRAGSLGRAYLHFVESEGITADGWSTRAAWRRKRNRRCGSRVLAPAHARHSRRLACRDRLQGRPDRRRRRCSRSALPRLKSGDRSDRARRLPARGRTGVRRQVLRGFARGVRARWLVAFDWEEALARPLRRRQARASYRAPPSTCRCARTDLASPPPESAPRIRAASQRASAVKFARADSRSSPSCLAS